MHLDPPWTAECWQAIDQGAPFGQGPSAPWSALAACLEEGLHAERVGQLLEARGWWGAVHFSVAVQTGEVEAVHGGVEAVMELVAAKAQVAAWIVGTCSLVARAW